MRQVKYRLWCNNKKEWEKDAWHLTPDGRIIDSNRQIEMKSETHFLNQFTGLLDKQGVEIYEGDVVAYDLGFDDEKHENYKIVFDNKQCAYFMFPLNDKSRLRHFTYSAKNDCEVIGNIYENSELLN